LLPVPCNWSSMEFRGDERAVVIQIGAVLLLAALVIAMSGYQATVVPDQNNEIEFNHNQQVQGEMQDLRNGIVSTAGGSGGSSYSVTLGTTYPARTLFVNPTPPSGQLRTLGTGEVLIENANATGSEDSSVQAYWNGTSRTVNTTAFAYRPNYNELKSAPTTVYEHSLLYNAHPTGANTTVTDQVLVDGNEITLVTLAGEVQESSSGTASVNVRTESASTSSVSVTDDGSPIRITVPTRSPDVWAKALPANATVVGNTTAGGGDYVLSTIELAPDEYELRMARARIGNDRGGSSPDTDAEYLVEVDDGGPVAAGEPTDVIAEVRNRHNNPVKNAEVQYDSSRGSGTKTTDRNGRVRIPSEGGDNVTAWIVASDYGSAEKYERVAIEVPTSGGGSGGGGGTYSIDWDATAIEDDNSAITSCSGGTCIYNLDDGSDAEMTAQASVSGASVDFAIDTGSPASLVAPEDTETQDDGTAITTIDVNTSAGADGDTFDVHVSSGGASDVVTIELNSSGSTPTASFTVNDSTPAVGQTVEFDGSGSSDSDGTITSYDWDFDDGSTATGEVVNHSYSSSGTYNVSLTVTDDDGATDIAYRQITVDNPSSDTISVVAGETSEVKSGRIAFALRNSGGEDVNLTTITVNSTTDKQATFIRNDSSAGHELNTNRTGYQNGQIDIGSGSQYPLDVEAVLPATTDTRLTLGEFRKSTGSGSNIRSIGGEDVTITLYYADGSQETVTLTVP